MIKVLVSDFDGVIVRNSESIKLGAWPIVFASYGESYLPHFKAAEAKFGGGRGGDRFDILRETFRGLGEPEDIIPNLVRSGAQAFDEYVQAQIQEAGVTPHDRAVLAELSKRYPLYLNSATPVEVLKQTVKNLGLDSIVKGSLGRPKTKVENFMFVQAQENSGRDEIVFLGDSDSDYKAAQEFGCKFVGLANTWNKWQDEAKPFPMITDLGDLEQYL